jgi:hypothetical protein
MSNILPPPGSSASDASSKPAKPTAPAAKGTAAAKATTTGPDGRKRVRKYHPRGFSGCSTCKTRHVKCDEETPKCRNCVRLGLQCDGPQGLSMFKMYDQNNMPKDAASAAAAAAAGGKPGKKAKHPSASGPMFSVMTIRPEPSASAAAAAATPTTTTAAASIPSRPAEEPVTKKIKEYTGEAVEPPKDEEDDVEDGLLQLVPQKRQGEVYYDISSIQSWDNSYHSHFLNGLSSIMIIWDAPHNLNPFRKCIPQFAQTSFPLTEAMKALGALHMANSTSGSDKILHLQNAVAKYNSVIQALKTRWNGSNTRGPRLDDLAVCLLMCIYEVRHAHALCWTALTTCQMMDSRTENWKVHLKGARDIYNQIFNANTGEFDLDEEDAMESERPFRRFLVSLMAYLDVAGAVSTGEGTMLQGSYWESHGGWEYNLGVSSCVMADRDSHLSLTMIRAAWSTLMSIQADVSAYANLKRQGMSLTRQRQMRADLETRLANWVLNAPPAFQEVDTLTEDKELTEHDQILECAGCVKAYERATLVYCYRCTAEAGGISDEKNAIIEEACDRILFLVKKLATGIGQLGMLWALFIAGTQLADAPRQEFVKSKLVEMGRFGFSNVNRASEILEVVWAMKKISPGYDWFQSQSFANQPAYLMP